MRFAVPAALLALAAASPALATGGFTCRPLSGPGPTVSMGFGHAISAPVFVAEIRDGKQSLRAGGGERDPIRIGQSWIDGRHLWLDLINAQASRFEVKLRAIGTLERGGRTYRVRCEES